MDSRLKESRDSWNSIRHSTRPLEDSIALVPERDLSEGSSLAEHGIEDTEGLKDFERPRRETIGLAREDFGRSLFDASYIGDSHFR